MIEALLNGVSYDILYSTAGQPNIYLGWNIEYDMRNISVIENNDYYVEYYYNASGIGIGKTIDNNNSIEYVDYVLEGSNIIKETHTGSNNYTLEYYYDAYSRIINTEDTSEINPYRYRGYYYDIETGLAMVGQRYYSPEFGRFIQPADVSSLNPSSINGLNLYAYANNNPIGNAYNSSGYSGNISPLISSVNFSNRFVSLNKKFNWPNLDFLGTGFGYAENIFSVIAGTIDGIRNIKHLNKLAGLEKASNWLMGIGIGLNVGLSFYNNLINSNLSSVQKAGNIVGDIGYIAVSSFATWGVSALTALIPVVGPFIAPIVGFAFGTAFDQFWHGEEIFGIEGFSFNPGGKSIDEWIKEFLTELFGG